MDEKKRNELRSEIQNHHKEVKDLQEEIKLELHQQQELYKEEIAQAKKDLEEDKEKLHTQIEKSKEDLEHKTFVDLLRELFDLHDDVADHDEIRDRILSGGKFTGTNMWVLVLAIVIASVGLNTGSTAVIIGAMLISPLMGSILAMAYGTASVDKETFAVNAFAFVAKIILSVGTACIYFALSPVKEPTTELIARTNPSFFDVIIATAGGLAGIIGQTRKDKANNIIPGVAIATALMPPLCTCGYAIANGRWSMLLGAFYLFLINSYFIYISSTWILCILKVPQVKEISDKEWRSLRKRMFRNAILISLPTIILLIVSLEM